MEHVHDLLRLHVYKRYSLTKHVFPYSFAWVEFTQQVVLSM